jgi:hydrogenase maturation protease
MNPSVLIVGFGNPLVGDDGVGIAVIERLLRIGLPSGIRAEVGETDSLRLPDLWAGEGEIWLVDAVLNGGLAGSIRVLDHDDLLDIPQRHASAHRLSLPESLRWIRLGHPEMKDVRYRLWGIEPAVVRHVEGLTPAVARAADQVVIEIRGELARRLQNVVAV